MQQAETNPFSIKGAVGRWCTRALAIALLAVVPVAAVAFVANWALSGATTLARGEDPLTSGLRIVQSPRGNTRPAPAVTETSTPPTEADVVLLQNWDYTDIDGSSRR